MNWYKCVRCQKGFDAKGKPQQCPYCVSSVGFAKITIKTPDGKKLSHEAGSKLNEKSHIESVVWVIHLRLMTFCWAMPFRKVRLNTIGLCGKTWVSDQLPINPSHSYGFYLPGR